MIIPILQNHDQRESIGFVEAISGQLCVRFAEGTKITRDMVFRIFGDAGMQVHEATGEDGMQYIRRVRILEWSLSPQPVAGSLSDAEILRIIGNEFPQLIVQPIIIRKIESVCHAVIAAYKGQA